MPDPKPTPVYGEKDLAVARYALDRAKDQGLSDTALLREIAGAVAGSRRKALEEAAADWDANTNHVCDAPDFLRELAAEETSSKG